MLPKPAPSINRVFTIKYIPLLIISELWFKREPEHGYVIVEIVTITVEDIAHLLLKAIASTC